MTKQEYERQSTMLDETVDYIVNNWNYETMMALAEDLIICTSDYLYENGYIKEGQKLNKALKLISEVVNIDK